jgi:organic hydroperoxide reductase OsmC/OhrA
MTQTAQVSLHQDRDFRFAIQFDEHLPPFYGDEPPPLGASTGPSPSQLLAAAVGNCLSNSLLFALRKYKQAPEPINTEAAVIVDRNPEKRLRVQEIRVRLQLGVPRANLQHLDRALAQFEEFCTVSQSVRRGLPVNIEVYDSVGERLK